MAEDCLAPPPALVLLKKRAEFLRAAQARRQGTEGVVLQARRRARDDGPQQGIRFGLTCSRKIGNAVMRNRAKRRLRALARELLPALGKDGWDYVLVGRRDATVARPFDALRADLTRALRLVHADRPGGRPATRPRRPDAPTQGMA